jgi:hypothetical protein
MIAGYLLVITASSFTSGGGGFWNLIFKNNFGTLC